MGKKFYAMMAVLAFAAGSMDVNAVYTLDGIEVSADREKDRFGKRIKIPTSPRSSQKSRHPIRMSSRLPVFTRKALSL